jgi:hypothetical protein
MPDEMTPTVKVTIAKASGVQYVPTGNGENRETPASASNFTVPAAPSVRAEAAKRPHLYLVRD